MDGFKFRQSLEFLQGHALLGGFSNEEMAELMPLFKEDSFLPGVEIVTQGEMGNRLYFIEEGCVEVIKIREDGSETPLIKLVMGDTFGEMELIDVQPRSASVRTLEKVQCLSLSNGALLTLYESNIELYTRLLLNIAREISRRLRKMDDRAVLWPNASCRQDEGSP